jgi:hypothetical protein
LSGVVDFAGTYPPASLSVADAVAEYAAAAGSTHAWMLGRLVWPAATLGLLRDELRVHGFASRAPWRVSAVVGADAATDFVHAREMSPDVGFVVDAIEVRAADAADIERLVRVAPAGGAVYIEIASAADPAPMLSELKPHGWHAKIRTGGVTADAFPPSAHVLRFLARCIELDVQCKATAGLHHPVRGEYPLAYEPGCPSGVMFGFLNLLVAVALLERGEASCAALALDERDPRAFTLSDETVRWRDRELTASDAVAARRRLHSFGSCSFREPAGDLVAIGAL